ncbi:hypothetical protein EKH57_00430 (plasmid) [Halorubrum sp. BOL3-1]|uniref:hypothetical protein n=1 Tax=Halorubrum sp. BOL3-1 TaxID=2497325 RepID=UPI001004EA9E|nr:hypothetical protein [Halorubrum sp. BOL3-1]QAU11381.1 hypothetical protein EKH57_00430 [Halorubrum sp. BOL3-1]
MIDEDLDAIIESVADYHDIPRSRAVELLLRKGVQAREMRYRFEQLDAKLDHLIDNLGVGSTATDAVEERFGTVSDRSLPADVSGVELADSPLPYFRSAGDYPDRSDEEATVRDQVLDERDAIETADDD